MGTFDEILTQVVEVLQREGRVSYRALKRRFNLDDEYIDDLKDELIEAKQLAADEGGKVLIWTGTSPVSSFKFQVSGSQSPDFGLRTPDSGLSSGERRQLTVMFCDLVGSTALSARLDPEELHQIVHAYQQCCAEVIQRYDGHIAQYLGDGLLVYFGYLQAHEDDARRAVSTGLAILEGLHQLNTCLSHALQVRIGIHTGQVMMGALGGSGKQEQLALGDAPNIAARVQGAAAPDEILVTAATQRLVEGLFAFHNLGSHEIKGLSTPLVLYQAVAESGTQSRFEMAVATSLTPLVGREQEVGLLLERWERVKEGAGQVVLLSGEAGIGKSRLVQALKERVAGELQIRLECRCAPYYQNSAFYPVIDLLQRVFQLKREDTPEERLSKLEEALRPYGFASPEVAPLFASLLSLPLLDRYAPLTLTPQQQKEKTQQAVLAWLLKGAEKEPLRLTVEDLHWADPSTLELLDLLLDQTPTARMLVLLTFRPEFIPPWASRSYLTPLVLSRLPRTQAEVMVEKITGGKALPSEVLQQIVLKTDGVPLFVEELTKMVVESDLVREADGRYEMNGPLPPLAIPSTLQDSLMARLDRLATAREIAQLGATVGREFSYELLQAISPLDEETLQKGLRQLVEAELVYQRGRPPQAHYFFKHALVQDTAYQSLLKSKRQQLHRQVAQVLEEQFTETAETQPELVAHHYTEAGLGAQAIPYWQQAGERAVQRSAHAEAITHLTKGLELLAALPDTPERSRQELTLRTTLGPALIATKGNAAPEVEQTYARAVELCRQVGETPQLFPVLFGLRSVYLVRGAVQRAHELGEQLLSLAESTQDPGFLLEARIASGNTFFFHGDLARAQAQFEHALGLYDPQHYRSHAVVYGLDPGVFSLCRMAHILWLRGYPDQSLQKAHDGLTLVQEISHSFSLAIAGLCVANLHIFRREPHAVQQHAEATITLCAEHKFANILGQAMLNRGWALAEQGLHGEGIAQIRQGLAACQATGAVLFRPFFLAFLIDACWKAEQTAEGLSAVAEALAVVDKNGERFHEAELYRLKGELSLQSAVHSRQSAVTNPQSPIPNPKPRPKRVFSGLSRLLVSSKRSRWSCGR